MVTASRMRWPGSTATPAVRGSDFSHTDLEGLLGTQEPAGEPRRTRSCASRRLLPPDQDAARRAAARGARPAKCLSVGRIARGQTRLVTPVAEPDSAHHARLPPWSTYVPQRQNPRPTQEGRGFVPDTYGGASRARTGDLLAASQTLSQLSYGPGSAFIVETGARPRRADGAPVLRRWRLPRASARRSRDPRDGSSRASHR